MSISPAADYTNRATAAINEVCADLEGYAWWAQRILRPLISAL
jgi:hypothetical protein